MTRPFPADKFKYLVPSDFTVGQLVYVIRKRMRLPPEVALFMYCGAALPSSTTVIQELYSSAKNVDGFLYLTFATENAFGEHAPTPALVITNSAF